jgi:hypothetical protein
MERTRLVPRFLAAVVALLSSAMFFSGSTTLTAAAPGKGPVDSTMTSKPLYSLISRESDGPHKVKVAENYGRLPLYFIENRGQVDKQVKFYAQRQGYALFFTEKNIVFTLQPASKRQENYLRENRILYKNAKKGQKLEEAGSQEAIAVRISPLGISRTVDLVSTDPQKGRVNYFIGDDPATWQTGITTFKAVVYREAYPGIDLKF